MLTQGAREGSQQDAINGQGGGGDCNNMGSFLPFCFVSLVPELWQHLCHGGEKCVLKIGLVDLMHKLNVLCCSSCCGNPKISGERWVFRLEAS